MNAKRAVLVSWLLRLFGAVDCLALAAVVMPRSMMESVSLRLGFAPFSSGPLPEYLARSTSLLYALHGALLLYLAHDVVRHWGLIRWLGLLSIGHGVAIVAIDLDIGMPTWWCFAEGPTFAAAGLVLWWLTRRDASDELLS